MPLEKGGLVRLYDTVEDKELLMLPATASETLRHPQQNTDKPRFLTMAQKFERDEAAKVAAQIDASREEVPINIETVHAAMRDVVQNGGKDELTKAGNPKIEAVEKRLGLKLPPDAYETALKAFKP